MRGTRSPLSSVSELEFHLGAGSAHALRHPPAGMGGLMPTKSRVAVLGAGSHLGTASGRLPEGELEEAV